jgi:hypothetical protein
MSVKVEELKNLKDHVYRELMNCESSRDDDNKLIANLWFKMCKKRGSDLFELPSINLLQMLINKHLPSGDSITRCRRKLNEQYPDTRGKSYKGRKKEQEEVRKEIHNL